LLISSTVACAVSTQAHVTLSHLIVSIIV